VSLSNLTASGWIWFALTLAIDLAFAASLAGKLETRDLRITINPLLPTVFTAWLLWLVTP
jgi:hypothetical protein